MHADYFITCIDYPYGGETGCPLYGDDLGVDGNNIANDACCYCGGGMECTNLEGWVDSGNDTCSWYVEYDSPGCPLYGDMHPNEDEITANDACCYCQAVAEVEDDGKFCFIVIFFGLLKSFLKIMMTMSMRVSIAFIDSSHIFLP